LPLLWLLEAAALLVGLAFGAARRALPPRPRPALTAAAVLAIAAYVLAPAIASNLLRAQTPPGMTAHRRTFDGDLRLLGYQLMKWDPEPQPGDPVRVRLYWQLDAPAAEPVRVELTLADGEGTAWGATETPLGLATFRQIPVTTWPVGPIMQEEYTLPLAELPPYALQTDLLLTVDGQTERLLTLHPATLTRVRPPDQALDYRLEGLARLTGYDVRALPHRRLAVTLHWEASGATDVPYTTFVHLVAADGTLVAQQDGPPFGGRLPTTDWGAGDTLADTYVVQTGRGVPKGTYSLRAGLYNPEDGSRLPVTDPDGQPVPDDAAALGEIDLPAR
jgi:hypothetical protein